MKRIRRNGRSIRAEFAIFVTLLLFSCATGPKIPPDAALLSLLDPGAIAYLHVSGAAARRLAPALLDAALVGGKTRASLNDLLRRTGELGLALMPTIPESRGAPREPAKGSPSEGLRLPAFEAALRGDFPTLGLGLSLATNQAWTRSGPGWRHRATGLTVTSPDRNLLLTTSTGRGAFLATGSRVDPLPPRFAEQVGAEILVWLPEPLVRLGPSLSAFSTFLVDVKMPLDGILLIGRLPKIIVGSPAELDPEITFDMVFLLDGSESARIYRPVLRFAWAYLSRSWLPPETASVVPAFTLKGETIIVTDLHMRATSLATLALGPVGQGLSASRSFK